MAPRILLTSDTRDFDPKIIQDCKDEGFKTRYIAYDGVPSDYQDKLQKVAETMEALEKYAIVGM